MLRLLSFMFPRFGPMIAVAVTLAAATVSRVAHADPASVQRADALFQDARAAVREGNWEKACPEFAESLKLDPAPGTRINLGECEERAGHLVSAWQLYDQSGRELAADDPRLPIARQRAAAVDARIPRLIVPSGVTVRVDGDPAPKAGEVRLDPGRHAIVVLGTPARSLSFAVAASERYTVPPEEAETAAATSERKVAGYVVGGVGVAAIATGLVLGGLALHDKNVVSTACDGEICSQRGLDAKSDGRTVSTISTVAVGVGVVAIAAGLYLVLTSPSAPSGSAHASAGLGGLRVRF